MRVSRSGSRRMVFFVELQRGGGGEIPVPVLEREGRSSAAAAARNGPKEVPVVNDALCLPSPAVALVAVVALPSLSASPSAISHPARNNFRGVPLGRPAGPALILPLVSPAKCTPEYLASHYPISCPVPSTAYPTTNHIDTLSPLTWILRRWFISRVYVTSNPVCHPHDASHPSMVLSVVCYAVLILLVSKRADIRVIETAVVVAGSLSMPSMP